MTIYLYVKQHSVTGLKYFGKTLSKDPLKYKGSGKHWLRHLKKHGNEVDTIELWEFDNQEQCTEFALHFSKENNIVESTEWANLQDENGLDGNYQFNFLKGKTYEEIHGIEKAKRLRSIRKWPEHTVESRRKMSEIAKLRKHSDETKKKMSNSRKGKQMGLNNPMFGKIMTKEHSDKIHGSVRGSKWYHNPVTKVNKRSKEDLTLLGYELGRK